MGRVSVVSLGCPKNLVDTDNLLAILEREGFSRAPDEGGADIVLVNTCGFIEDAKKESIEEILKLRHIKDEGKTLLVFGCLAKRYGEQLKKEIPEIDALYGVGEEEKIVEYCKSLVISREVRKPASQKAKRLKTDDHRLSTIDYRPSTFSYAYLKVAEGCSRGCTYCVIPSIRGPYKSAAPDRILKKAEEHIKSGISELILVAQDLGSYGREFRGYKLASLVRDIALIRGDFWVRLLYLNPSTVGDGLLSAIADNDKVCRYIDMPLQHSEDRILGLMGRAGTRKAYARTIAKIRAAIPGVTMRTTFMVGFPGETEKDFAGLKDFVEEIRFERLGVFAYSKEEGTPACKLRGQVSKRTKERRRDEIMRIQAGISLEKNLALVGKRFRAIVDEVSGETAVARLASQAPEIDGVVIIEGSKGQRVKGSKSLKTVRHSDLNFLRLKTGSFVNVKITDAYDYDLKGEVVR